MLRNLEDRFPKPQIFFAFRIFDVKEIPLDLHQRKLYGNRELQPLISGFEVASVEQILKVQNDYIRR